MSLTPAQPAVKRNRRPSGENDVPMSPHGSGAGRPASPLPSGFTVKISKGLSMATKEIFPFRPGNVAPALGAASDAANSPMPAQTMRREAKRFTQFECLTGSDHPPDKTAIAVPSV